MATKRRDKSAWVDNIARNERQKMTLLVEHSHILGRASKVLIDENSDLIERTKKLIEKSIKNIRTESAS